MYPPQRASVHAVILRPALTDYKKTEFITACGNKLD